MIESEGGTSSTVSHTTLSFVRSSQRVLENVVWDVVDYYFRLDRGSDSCEIAVGIPGDWQDRVSQALLRKLAEAWLTHRLEHGYDPFGEQPHGLRIMQVPFSIVDYWYLHGRLPH